MRISQQTNQTQQPAERERVGFTDGMRRQMQRNPSKGTSLTMLWVALDAEASIKRWQIEHGFTPEPDYSRLRPGRGHLFLVKNR